MIDKKTGTGQLVIRLDAVAKNWQCLNHKVIGAECAAVVKANAYGLGVASVTECLFAAGCRTFFVATMDEAIELRQALQEDYRLVVFGGQAAPYPEECVHYEITPILITYEQILNWSKSATDESPAPFIKFDSGMHRFGLMPEEMGKLLEDNDVLARLSPACFMSHLACADTSRHPLNLSQLTLFSHYYSKLKQRLPMIKASLANSSACFLDERYYFDLCRPGIALYGGNPTPAHSNPMQLVVYLTLPIIQIKTLNKGETVGYGADFRADSVKRIALVFGGYADGLFRLLGNKGKGFLGTYSVPMVGRVSMDAIAFDVSHIPESVLCSEGSIEILGDHQSVDDLAVQADTIAYEVLTNLGSRYQRQYLTVEG